MAAIGEIIKAKRQAHNLSLKKLGKACHISDTEISKIETGERKTPNWINLCKIASALDSNPLEFLITAGYISENDIYTPTRIQNINKLDSDDIRYLQLFVDFIISRKYIDNDSRGGL